MAAVQLRTDAEAFTAMMNRVLARTELSSIADASAIPQVLLAVANEFGEAYHQMFNIGQLHRLRFAALDDLDALAREIIPGTLRRLPPRTAIGSVQFSRPTVTGSITVIPSGSLIVDDNGTRFQTTAQAEIAAASTASSVVSAIAVDPGTSGNVGAGTVTRMLNRPTGVSGVTNVTSFVGGRDAESDEEFRGRLMQYVASLSRCTVEAIELLTLGVTNDTTGKQVVYNHVFEDPVDRGNVTLYIDDGAGTAAERQRIGASGGGNEVTAPSGSIQIFTADDAGSFDAGMVGQTVTIAGFTDTDNNGSFVVQSVLSDQQLSYLNANAGASAESGAAATWAFPAESVTASAAGGEEFLYLTNKPVDEDTLVVTSDTRGVLTLGTEVSVNPASSLLYFTPALLAGEAITARYSHYINLIADVQRIVDGDPDNRTSYPGIRAAGVLVRVKSPDVRSVAVASTIVVLQGYDAAEVAAACESAVITYINTLGISGDVIVSELIQRIMEVPGVFDCAISTPTSNVVIDDHEIARTTASSVDIDY